MLGLLSFNVFVGSRDLDVSETDDENIIESASIVYGMKTVTVSVLPLAVTTEISYEAPR